MRYATGLAFGIYAFEKLFMQNHCRKYAGLLLAMVALFLILPSCGDLSKRFESRVNALGVTNEIVVIADQSVWEGMAGDTVDYYFGSPYPIMPQPEPMFDLRHFTTEELNSEDLRKELRTYLVVANLSDEDSPTNQWVKLDLGEEKLRKAQEDPRYFSTIGRDKWARGQLLIYVFAYGQQALSDKIVEGFPAMAKLVRTHDASQIEAVTYLDGQNGTMMSLIQEKFGVIIKVPGDYKNAIEDENFLWLRKDDPDVTSNLVFTRRQYENPDQLTKDALIALRDTLGLRIGSTEPGSYSRTNTEDLPVYMYEREVAGNFTREIRGIWEMEGDFLGGPFVSHAILYPDQHSFVFIDVFVFAPGVDKRDHIQRLEFIVNTLKFP